MQAKKMYVIHEVDEDDYLSDPNASRMKDGKLKSDLENTKVDIIFEDKHEDDIEGESPNKSARKNRPKSSQIEEKDE